MEREHLKSWMNYMGNIGYPLVYREDPTVRPDVATVYAPLITVPFTGESFNQGEQISYKIDFDQVPSESPTWDRKDEEILRDIEEITHTWRPSVPLKYDNLVVIGSTFINALFGDDTSTPNSAGTRDLARFGIEDVQVYGAGVAGETAADVALRIPSLLELFPTRTLFIVSVGEVEAELDRPSNGTGQSLAEPDAWPAIISAFDGRSTDVVYANIGFLPYGRTGELAASDYAPDEYSGLGAFNDDYLNDLILQQGLNSVIEGSLRLNLHTLMRNDYKEYFEPDGSTLTDTALTDLPPAIIYAVSNVLQPGANPVTPNIQWPTWETPENFEEARIDVNLGGFSDVNYIRSSDILVGGTVVLLDPQGTDVGVFAECSGASVLESGGGSLCNRPGDDNNTIFSEDCSASALRSTANNATFTLSIKGLATDTDYTIGVMHRGVGEPMNIEANGTTLELPASDEVDIVYTVATSDVSGALDIVYTAAEIDMYATALTLNES